MPLHVTLVMDTKSAADTPHPPSPPLAAEVEYKPESRVGLGQAELEVKAANPGTDGGLHAWLTVAGTFVAMFCQFGLANAYGAFQAYYEEHQLASYTSDAVGWIGGVQQFFLLFGVGSSERR